MQNTIYRVMGKRGRITIPYEFRQQVGFGYNDILSFTQQDDNTVIVNRYNSHGNVIETVQTGKAIPWNDTGKDKGETMTTVFDTFTITPNTFIVKARWDSYP